LHGPSWLNGGYSKKHHLATGRARCRKLLTGGTISLNVCSAGQRFSSIPIHRRGASGFLVVQPRMRRTVALHVAALALTRSSKRKQFATSWYSSTSVRPEHFPDSLLRSNEAGLALSQ
jgi:hypothetical protein